MQTAYSLPATKILLPDSGGKCEEWHWVGKRVSDAKCSALLGGWIVTKGGRQLVQDFTSHH